jgi:flagellar biosynthetic protein FliR
MLDIIFKNYMLFLLVFARMSGMILFNPFLGKRNVPVMIKMGLALFVSLITMPLINFTSADSPTFFVFIIAVLKELFIGFTVSFIMQMFISMVFISGEIMDLQLGIGMSKIYDPQSNISMPLSGTIYNIMYILMFFSTDSHFTLIRIITRSCEVFPPGFGFISLEHINDIVFLFGDILILSLKLAIPVIAIEILAEAGLGIIMKVVPQINVFVVGLPLKLLIGLFMIVLVLPATSRLFEASADYMFDNMEKILESMLSV